MIVKLLTEHYLEFLSLKAGCRGSSESTYVKMPHCWKFHALAHLIRSQFTSSIPNISGLSWLSNMRLDKYGSLNREPASISNWTNKTAKPNINKTIARFPTASVKPAANFTGVIILTYMRSGSSLTGDILQHSPNAFYVFEPLHLFNTENLPYVKPVNMTFVNGTRR